MTQCYDDLITTGYKYQLDNSKVDEYELKKKLWKVSVITVNILEGLRFYVSFVSVVLFGELKLLEGSDKDYFIYR